MNLDDINKISTIKQLSSKDYTLNYAINSISNDLKIINNINNQVGEYALKNLDFKSINLILELNNYLENKMLLLNNN